MHEIKKDNGSEKVVVFAYIKTGQGMMASGKMINEMDMEDWYFLMAHTMKANGEMTRIMTLDNIQRHFKDQAPLNMYIMKVPNILVNGERGSNMDTAKRLFRMGPFTKVNMPEGMSKAKVR